MIWLAHLYVPCSYTLLSKIAQEVNIELHFSHLLSGAPILCCWQLCRIQPGGWDIHCGTDCENQFNWKSQRWRSIIKIKLHFFSPCTRHPCSFLLVDLWQWERWCQIQPVGWDIHCGTDIAELFNWKNQRWRIVKSRPPFFSYLVLSIPVTVCCWLCGNESGGAKFSLRAEISTVVRT